MSQCTLQGPNEVRTVKRKRNTKMDTIKYRYIKIYINSYSLYICAQER